MMSVGVLKSGTIMDAYLKNKLSSHQGVNKCLFDTNDTSSLAIDVRKSTTGLVRFDQDRRR